MTDGCVGGWWFKMQFAGIIISGDPFGHKNYSISVFLTFKYDS